MFDNNEDSLWSSTQNTFLLKKHWSSKCMCPKNVSKYIVYVKNTQKNILLKKKGAIKHYVIMIAGSKYFPYASVFLSVQQVAPSNIIQVSQGAVGLQVDLAPERPQPITQERTALWKYNTHSQPLDPLLAIIPAHLRDEKDYSKNFTTMLIEHMEMFMVTFFHIQSNDQVMDLTTVDNW